jgi:hypothetical protein
MKSVNPELSGFAAMGKPIPYERKQRAYDAAKSIGVKDCFALVQGMSEQLERDKPYEAMQVGMKHVDLTGTYRIMATLLT